MSHPEPPPSLMCSFGAHPAECYVGAPTVPGGPPAFLMPLCRSCLQIAVALARHLVGGWTTYNPDRLPTAWRIADTGWRSWSERARCAELDGSDAIAEVERFLQGG